MEENERQTDWRHRKLAENPRYFADQQIAWRAKNKDKYLFMMAMSYFKKLNAEDREKFRLKIQEYILSEAIKDKSAQNNLNTTD